MIPNLNLARLKAWLRPFASRTGCLPYHLGAVVAIIAGNTFLGSRLIRTNATTIGFAFLFAVLSNRQALLCVGQAADSGSA